MAFIPEDTGRGQRPPAPLRKWGLAAALLILITAGAAEALSAAPLAEFLRLKETFENQVRRHGDPQIQSCLSAETSALAWTLTAAALAEDEDEKNEWLWLAADFEKTRGQTQDWGLRRLEALELYHQAFTDLTIRLVLETRRGALSRELNRLRNQTDDRLRELAEKTDAVLEKEVVLTGSLASLAALAVKAVGGAPLEKPVEAVIQDMLQKAREVSRRTDLHYRAKLSLIYAANLKGLTALVFLMGQNAGPPLSRELAKNHRALNQYGQGHNYSLTTSLTWVAQTQAALPVAYWLATH